MKLEELRAEVLGNIFIYFPFKSDDENERLLVTYPNYANTAFYLSCQNLEQLEKSSKHINQGNSVINAVGFWFIAMEAYINTLLKIACILSGNNFKHYKGKSINSRLNKACEILKIDFQSVKSSGIMSRLEEFKAFRNEIFHDRHHSEKLNFTKTYFSEVPYLANQVDMMQAAIIALEIFEAFRNSFNNLDLMPSIFIPMDDSFGFIKLDILYSELMQPLFHQCLKKHSLTTDLQTMPVSIRAGICCLDNQDIKMIIKAFPDDELNHPANSTESNIGASLLEKVKKHIHHNKEGTFQIPNYYR